MSDSDIVKIADLWARLHQMEGERRFNGRPYPQGMSAFPFQLSGQGFFPGGDGLWRNDSERAQTSIGVLPVGGCMFLANDFGTRTSYEKLRSKGFEAPPTWKHVKERVVRAGLPITLTFFTNAVMGLRDEGKALDPTDWASEPIFIEFCRAFLEYQIATVRPALLVVMGPVARATLEMLATKTARTTSVSQSIRVGEHVTAVHYTTHPYGDFNFSEERKAIDAAALKEAWNAAISSALPLQPVGHPEVGSHTA